ncbi:hypothetical protein [Ferrimicrobium acidiphilum]|uniref:hypothetical protein n=1 Tax=Ferrimicrobium acidiphilum TaxID=121039 RepID=UPI0023F148FA|nr:hypothetical protein [Ferrimicrobium acidiphilum]
MLAADPHFGLLRGIYVLLVDTLQTADLLDGSWAGRDTLRSQALVGVREGRRAEERSYSVADGFGAGWRLAHEVSDLLARSPQDG